MFVYDFEVFKYDWLVVFFNPDAEKDKQWLTIINDKEKLINFYNTYKNEIFIGFNSRNYDVPIWKCIMCGGNAYDLTNHIIKDEKKWFEFEGSEAFNNYSIYNYDVYLGLVDHGLKTLEAFMGIDIEESGVSFNIDRSLTDEELKLTIKYCQHDVFSTYEVFKIRREIFESYIGLLKEYNLSLEYLNKTRAQLSAKVINAKRRPYSNDEFDITIVDTLILNKYDYIRRWFMDESNRSYDKSYFIPVAGVYHKLAWGGAHSFIGEYKKSNFSSPKFISRPIDVSGLLLNIDVASYYPNLIKRYQFMSRAVSNPNIFNDIIEKRLVYKKEKNPIANSLKIVLNSTYGAMKDKYSKLYDPLMANNICVNGQLLLIDLIEKIENYSEILNTNTDGLIVKCKKIEFKDNIIKQCEEWSKRTGMTLEIDEYTRLVQRDVNSYIAFASDGDIKAKGALKDTSVLDNNLAIINKSIREYFINNIHPRDFILKNDDFVDYMSVLKLKGKYKKIQYEQNNILVDLSEKIVRAFASTDARDGQIGRSYVVQTEDKQKLLFPSKENGDYYEDWRFNKFSNTSDKVFIDNGYIINKKILNKLDKQWYIELVLEKLKNEWGVDLKT